MTGHILQNENIVMLFRDKLTLAVLRLRESGELEEMQKEWWDKRSQCPIKEGGQVLSDVYLFLISIPMACSCCLWLAPCYVVAYI